MRLDRQRVPLAWVSLPAFAGSQRLCRFPARFKRQLVSIYSDGRWYAGPLPVGDALYARRFECFNLPVALPTRPHRATT